MRPGEQPATGVGLAAVGEVDGAVEGHPAIEQRIGRVPGHRAVVAVARGHQPVRSGHARHLAQRGDRIAQVLQDLVGVDHIEGPIGEGQGVGVTDDELDVVDSRGKGVRASRGEHVLDRVQSDDPAGRDSAREVERDMPGPRADVEQRHPGSQVGQEIGRRVLGGPPAMRAQHTLVMAVRVGLVDRLRHGPMLADTEPRGVRPG